MTKHELGRGIYAVHYPEERLHKVFSSKIPGETLVIFHEKADHVKFNLLTVEMVNLEELRIILDYIKKNF